MTMKVLENHSIGDWILEVVRSLVARSVFTHLSRFSVCDFAIGCELLAEYRRSDQTARLIKIFVQRGWIIAS